jgi:cytochrome P450
MGSTHVYRERVQDRPRHHARQPGRVAQRVITCSAPTRPNTRLRRIVSAGFTARRVDRLEPRIAQITNELLDAMDGRDEVDLIDAFAFPLPIQVICELLGVPSDDQDTFRSWSNTIVSGGLDEDSSRATELRDVLGQLVAYIANCWPTSAEPRPTTCSPPCSMCRRRRTGSLRTSSFRWCS